MAKEIQIRTSLNVKSGVIDYRSNPTAYSDDLVTVGAGGPSPGKVNVTTAGVAVSLAALTNPAWCRIASQDNVHTDGEVYYVSYGIFDNVTKVFYPFGELLPGQTINVRLNRNMGQPIGTGTGTGTESMDTCSLFLKAHGAPVACLVEAFDA